MSKKKLKRETLYTQVSSNHFMSCQVRLVQVKSGQIILCRVRLGINISTKIGKKARKKPVLDWHTSLLNIFGRLLLYLLWFSSCNIFESNCQNVPNVYRRLNKSLKVSHKTIYNLKIIALNC